MLDPKLLNAKTLDEWARKLAASLPKGLQSAQQDLEKNLRAGLEGMFQKLDLVTREEYEVQVALLERTREKILSLEKHLQELEKATGVTRDTK